jgi:pimeloyl-ACP methyl ester carboxylesterase
MPQNFIECDREQELLLPPSLREWSAENHLAWYVIDAVAEMDLEPFYAAYRQDDWGQELAALTAGELIVMPGVGHEPQCRSPDVVNGLLEDFLTRTARTASEEA